MSKRDLPPWDARNQSERDLMERWVNHELDAILAQMVDDFKRNNMGKTEFTKEGRELMEIAQARGGNIEPLRKRYPRLAEFLHPPKQPGRGKRFKRNKYDALDGDSSESWLIRAAWDVARTRALWKHHYKRWKRAVGQISAEEIAARRYDIKNVEHLHEWMKSRRHPEDLFVENFLAALSARNRI